MRAVVGLVTLGGCVVDLPPDPRTPDASVPDAAVDAGPQIPCLFDQDSPEGPGCPLGQVCNLKTLRCETGRLCERDQDCLICSSAASAGDDGELVDACHHGFAVTSWCDLRHHPDDGIGICTRTRSPCERCLVDEDCGRLNDGLANPRGFGDDPLQVRCVDYGQERDPTSDPDPSQRFCTRPCNPFNTPAFPCPNGFACVGSSVTDGRCVQGRLQCDRNPVYCPASAESGGLVQISPPERCPEGGTCETNDRPGATGLCLGECETDADCLEPDRPICNRGNGLCIPGCGETPACVGGEQPQSCHPLVGGCDLACFDPTDLSKNTPEEADRFCEERYGDDFGEVYCNMPGRDGSDGRYYKNYHDPYACVRLGCEVSLDGRTRSECGVNSFCNLAAPDFPRCQPGCRHASSDTRLGDCSPGLSCRAGEDGVSYSPEQCAELEPFVPPADDPAAHGICCAETT